eukprot:1549748-Pleurochrysis_carterae.AAC.2
MKREGERPPAQEERVTTLDVSTLVSKHGADDGLDASNTLHWSLVKDDEVGPNCSKQPQRLQRSSV